MPTSKEWDALKKQEEELAKKLKAQLKKERAKVLPEIRRQCRDLGITAAMLQGYLKEGRKQTPKQETTKTLPMTK